MADDERGEGIVLTRADVRDEKGGIKGSLRESLGRKKVPVPELGRAFGIDPAQAKAWVWEVSALERLAIDRYANGAPGEDGHDELRWLESIVSFALRDSGDVGAKRLFEVPGPDNGKLVELGHSFLRRIELESRIIALGEDLAERVMRELEGFGKAEETPSSSSPTSSVSDD